VIVLSAEVVGWEWEQDRVRVLSVGIEEEVWQTLEEDLGGEADEDTLANLFIKAVPGLDMVVVEEMSGLGHGEAFQAPKYTLDYEVSDDGEIITFLKGGAFADVYY